MSVHQTVRRLYRSKSVAVYDFQCAAHDCNRCPEECSEGNHIVFPRSGVFERHADGASIVCDPNQVLFFNADRPYRVSHPVVGGDTCTVFELDPTLLREICAQHEPGAADRQSAFAHSNTLCDPELYLCHRALLRQLQQDGAPDALAIDEKAVALVDRTLYNTHVQHGTRRRSPRFMRPDTRRAHADCVNHVRLILASRWSEPLTLDEIARMVHVSPYHLARMFRRATGLPIHGYRNQLRLRGALERLTDDRDDLTTIALDVGFSSHSHLTAAFRATFGATPAHVRAQLSPRRRAQMSRNLKVRINA